MTALIDAMKDAMMGEDMVQRDVYLGRLSALLPDTTMDSLRSNAFKAQRMKTAGLCGVIVGNESYVVDGDADDIVVALEKVLSKGMTLKQWQARHRVDEAKKALAKAEAHAKAVGV
jgi:hypothetical protein